MMSQDSAGMPTRHRAKEPGQRKRPHNPSSTHVEDNASAIRRASVPTIYRVGSQDSANATSTKYCEGEQDSASAPAPHPSNPCPYGVGMWHLVGGGTPVGVSGGEG